MGYWWNFLMSKLYEAAWHLGDLLENSTRAYLRVEPEFLDYSIHKPGKIIIEGKGRVEIELNRNNVAQVAGMLEATIFDKEQLPVLLCYNIKPLFSYFRFYLQREIIPSTAIVDLNVIESFLNLNKKRPENLVEAINRSEVASKYKSWINVYKQVHLPFILRVMPSIETNPLLDTADKTPRYPYYEIEGQVSGRLNCLKKFNKGYLPHNLSLEQKQKLKPRGDARIFFSADYRHCEVTVLQWLSKDEVLKGIIESGEDLHSEIFRIILGEKCDTPKKRKISKRMFLPVMYGLGGKGLSKMLEVSEEVGFEIVDRIHRKFVTASRWMQAQQDKAKEKGMTIDCLGRPRKYAENEWYKARNHAVQGPAASVCAEKAIQLHNDLIPTGGRICYTVHDGYALTCPVQEAKTMPEIICGALESESKLCPGLNMGVEICYGKSLDQMKVLKGG